MGQNITIYVGALFTLLVGLVVAFLIPLIRSKTTGQQYDNIVKIVDIAVYAAEQLFGPGMGQKKLEEATKFIVEFVTKMGYKVDETEIRGMIEAAVKKMNDEIHKKEEEEEKKDD